MLLLLQLLILVVRRVIHTYAERKGEPRVREDKTAIIPALQSSFSSSLTSYYSHQCGLRAKRLVSHRDLAGRTTRHFEIVTLLTTCAMRRGLCPAMIVVARGSRSPILEH
jgi:hypothetical protein